MYDVQKGNVALLALFLLTKELKLFDIIINRYVLRVKAHAISYLVKIPDYRNSKQSYLEVDGNWWQLTEIHPVKE